MKNIYTILKILYFQVNNATLFEIRNVSLRVTDFIRNIILLRVEVIILVASLSTNWNNDELRETKGAYSQVYVSIRTISSTLLFL